MRPRPIVAQTVLASAACAALTGCLYIADARCTLSHIPQGHSGEIGRTLALEWGTLGVDYVEMNGFHHHVGNGYTAFVETSTEGFLAVVLQDAMGRLADGSVQRETNAEHYALLAGEDGSLVLHQWTRGLGQADGQRAQAARKGHYTPQRTPPEKAQRWTCKR